MKKVTAFIGTPSKKATFRSVQEFEKNLRTHGDIDFEYVFLSDYHFELCLGCKNCILKGEEYCPLKDDRDVMIDKMEHSDGVIFATPTYIFQTPARMKSFLDRLSFICHRPRFFKQVATSIAVQGFYGGSSVVKYLDFTLGSLGFRISKGCVITALDPMTENQKTRLVKKIKKSADSFYKTLQSPVPAPSFFRILLFCFGRTKVLHSPKSLRDYSYYKEKGWLESDYFYPFKLSRAKKLAVKFSDFIGRMLLKAE